MTRVLPLRLGNQPGYYSVQKERLVTSVRGVPPLSDSSSSCPVDQVEGMLCL